MTTPFDRISLRPASPQWIVRAILREHAIEVVYVGHCNRMELDSCVERIARYGWAFDVDAKDAGVVVLADSRAEMIGIRLVRTILDSADVVSVLRGFFGPELVSHGIASDLLLPPALKKG